MTTKDAVPSDEREFALSIYKPPFRFQHGYIFDAVNHMVVDDVLDGVKAARVRGWGRISYMPEPEKLQDTVGAMIADALTEYWNRRAPTPEVAAQEAGRVDERAMLAAANWANSNTPIAEALAYRDGYAAARRLALIEAEELCMRTTPDRSAVAAIGESAHYLACALAIRKLRESAAAPAASAGDQA